MPPSSMLESPCKAVQAGDTVRSLAKGYVNNTTCMFQYESSLEGLRQYYQQQKDLHKSE